MKKNTLNLTSSKKDVNVPVDPKEVRTLIFIATLFILFLAAIQIFSYSSVCIVMTVFVMPILGIVFGIHQFITGSRASDRNKKYQAFLFGTVLIVTTILLLATILLFATY